jgi:hypothetical protein
MTQVSIHILLPDKILLCSRTVHVITSFVILPVGVLRYESLF